jgi:hypothetical protein
MTKKDFNKLVEQTKKNLLSQHAEEVFKILKGLDLYRNGGLEGTLDYMLTEIAQAQILGVDFVDKININEEIKNL